MVKNNKINYSSWFNTYCNY